jgi:hypothetical protein
VALNIPIITMTKYPIGLLSNTQSNSQSNSEIALSTYGFSDKRRIDISDNAFFIEPYVDKHNKRKERITNHQNNVLEVFRKWHTIELRRVETIDGLYKTCIPLYVDVVGSLQRQDKYNEGVLHLLNYSKQYNTVLNIISLQSEHNLVTSQFMIEREQMIKTAISDNENMSIKEWNSSDDTYSWYKLEKIFAYFEGEARQHINLKIVSYSQNDGIDYYSLFRNPDDLIAVGEKKVLENIKELINSELENTVNKLRRLLDNIDEMQNYINTFVIDMDKIIYRVTTRGLQGRCDEEQEIQVPMILRGRVMRFFRRHVLRNPPV